MLEELEQSWDPWCQFDQLQDAMTQVLWGQRSAGSYLYPALNAWTNDNEAVVTAEIPGIDPNNLDISVVGDTLTIRGSREAEKTEDGMQMLRSERPSGPFSRSLQLPFHVDAEKVTADSKNGILTITLPFAESGKPRKIMPKAA